MIVAARNSAFIVSLFAYWLDPEGQPIVYYDSLRKGLFTLIKAELLPASPQLHMGPNAIEILSAIDHDACLALINDLASREPTLPAHRYWIEYFCFWVIQNVQSLTEPSNTLVKDTDADNILIQASGGVTSPVQLPVSMNRCPTISFPLPHLKRAEKLRQKPPS